MTTPKWLPFLNELADIANDISLHYFKKTDLKIDLKDNQTPVSQADLEIETKIREITRQKYPDLQVVGEEYGSTQQPTNTTKLIVDPIDGTSNFIRGIPFFAALLAIEHDQKIVAGLVNAPATRDRWEAELNQGSFHNQSPIQVSSLSLEEGQAFYGSLYGAEARDIPDQMHAVLQKTKRQRGFGDYYAHMLVAMGCGEVSLDYGLKVWDIAPLKIIVEEAGGKVTDLAGEASIYNGTLLCSNGHVHQTVLDLLNPVRSAQFS